MLKQTFIAAATALAIGAGAIATTTPAAADNFGFYLNDRGGFGVYGGDGPRHPGPPQHRKYQRFSDSGCWAWSKRLQQRVWTCGPPPKHRNGPPPWQQGQGYWDYN